MKITMYELLGLIKDGKAPEKIMYNNVVWEYVNHEQDYRSRHNAELFFNDEINNTWIMTHLNTQIEILKEEKKIPKRIQSNGENLYSEYIGQWLVDTENYTEYDELLMNKINEIIDYLKSKGE